MAYSLASSLAAPQLSADSFQRVELCHRELINHYLAYNANMSCDMSFTNLYVWGDVFQTSFAVVDEMLIISCMRDGERIFMQPVGCGDYSNAISTLYTFCKNQDEGALRILPVMKSEIENLVAALPEQPVIEHLRDNDDYIHLTKSLGELIGKRFHGKRGHVKKFRSTYQYDFQMITQDSLESVLKLNKQWTQAHEQMGTNSEDENITAQKLLNNFDALSLQGCTLSVDGKTVAASIGSSHRPGSDMFVIHYEKALLEYEGAYSTISNHFSMELSEHYKYINREEDMGIEGLRKSKLSYHPDILLEKYAVILPL